MKRAALFRHAERLRSAHNDQRGLTLIEVLLVSAISAMIAVPVLAWMLTAFRTQVTVTATSQRTQVTTQLTQVFPRDMSGAKAVLHPAVAGGSSSPPYQCSGANAVAAVAAVLGSDGKTIAVYGTRVAGTATSVVRQTCLPDGPALTDEVLGNEIRSAGSGVLTAVASTSAGVPGGEASVVTLTLALPDSRPIEIGGSLRTGKDPVP